MRVLRAKIVSFSSSVAGLMNSIISSFWQQSVAKSCNTAVLSYFNHVWLFVTLWVGNPPGSPVHEVLQARILEWVAMPSFRDLPDQGSNPPLLYLLHWQADSYHQHRPQAAEGIFQISVKLSEIPKRPPVLPSGHRSSLPLPKQSHTCSDQGFL